MSWGKVDDALHDHRKVDALLEADELNGAAAMGLWVVALSYCSDQLTDGVVSRRAVARLVPEHGQQLAALLVAHDLWRVVDVGWEINGFLDCNPSREEVLAKRAQDAARKAAARAKAAKSTRKSGRTDADVRADGHGDDREESGAPSAQVSSSPDPTRPDPTRTGPISERDR